MEINIKRNASRRQRSAPRKSKNKQVQARKRSRAKKLRQSRNRAIVSQERFYKSPCLAKYMKALIDPFGYHNDVCVPDLDVRPSSKYRVVVRSQMATGTQGFGYAVFSPFNMAFSDQPAGHASTSDYIGSTIAVSGPGTIGITASTAPFFSNLAVLNGVRVAAFGIRSRYLGTELNRSGRLAITLSPSPETSLSAANATALLNYRATKTFPVTRNWVNLIWVPRMAIEYEYSGPGDQALQPLWDKWSMAISAFDGVPGNSFEMEAVAYLEYVGTLVNLTPSHSDIVGLSAVRGVIGECDVQNEGGKKALEILEAKADNFMSYASSHVISGVASVVAAQGARLLYGGANRYAPPQGPLVEEFDYV